MGGGLTLAAYWWGLAGTPAHWRPEHVRLTCCVQDYFPDQEMYADDGPDGCPVPDLVSQFVYPDGYTLSSEDLPPQFFSFVLTNVNGVRSYGCTLRIWEELDSLPDPPAVHRQLHQAFEQAGLTPPPWVRAGPGQGDGSLPSPSPGSSVTPTPSPIAPSPPPSHSLPQASFSSLSSQPPTPSSVPVFLPKALVLLSHYPFLSVFREVLLEFYRISISSAPVPIERYIANFVCEVPLPPQGQIDVKFALPDRTLTISRPPRNRLPLAAFSFRPLFTLLSVDNILVIFSLLLMESKVAIFSARYALLTPVIEALLALLFPFVWQGALIPVMPMGMCDILDAPVPFFVGLHRCARQEYRNRRTIQLPTPWPHHPGCAVVPLTD
jgi:DENN domain-containing protein 5